MLRGPWLAVFSAFGYVRPMLSVLIETRNDEDGLARTLASLIGAAVEGIVREVIVCDLGSTDHTHKVADAAGCVWLPAGGVAAGVRQAKGDWLLFIEPGATLVDGWIDSAVSHCAKATIAGRFRRSRSARVPFLGRILGGNRALAHGLVIRKSQAVGLSRSGQDAEGVGRGLATKQLAGEIVPAQRK